MRMALCWLVLTASGVVAAEPTRLTVEVVDRFAQDAQKKWGTPGVAVVVVQLPEAPILRGYGVRQLGLADPITPDTLFPLASCTKAFTSTLLAQLIEEGRLTWDDPVQKHWPEFKLSDPNISALLTVRDLLAHRTGLAGHDFLWYRAPWNLDESLRRMQKLPIEGQFRHTYHYSSLPVMVAGRVAEKVMNKPWAEQVRERIVKPLQLEHVTFTTEESQKYSNRATGHVRKPSGVEVMPEYPLKEANPAGSISITPRSLANWLKFQLEQEKLLAVTRTPQVNMPKDAIIGPLYPESLQVSYCLGWVQFDYHGELVYAHGGLMDGFRIQLTLLPSRKIAFAVLANLHETKLTTALSYSLLDAIKGRSTRDWNSYFAEVETSERAAKKQLLAKRDTARVPGTRPSLPLEKYVGEYVHPAYGSASISLDQGQLVWSWSSFRSKLEHFQRDQFRLVEGHFVEELLEFGGQNGEATIIAAMGQYFQKK